MGTALLSSCGGGGSGGGGIGPPTVPPLGPVGGAPLPNGFGPSQVLGSGSGLPDGTRVMAAAAPTPSNSAFNGLVHLRDGGGELVAPSMPMASKACITRPWTSPPIRPATAVDLGNSLGRGTIATLLENCCDQEVGELLDVEFAPLAS